jgi:hypothetical protein
MLAAATIAPLLAGLMTSTSASAAITALPPARFGTGMAYDQTRGEVVMFGGSGDSGYLGDTWT